MTTLNVYIDGFNLYHAVVAQNDPRLKWINMMELGRSFLRPGEHLNRVVFFTAVLTWDRGKQMRHKNFIAAQEALNVEVVRSNFRNIKRHCKIMDRYCKRHEEKQTDVALSMAVFSDVMRGDCDRVVLITADSDQVPMVQTVRQYFPKTVITLAAPPDRGGEARELGSVVHDRVPIKLGRLRACPLPRDVYDSTGRKVATMPAVYQV